MTIAYPVNIVQSEIDLILTGQTPQKVLFHIERIDISRVPSTDQDIAKWINKSFFHIVRLNFVLSYQYRDEGDVLV